MAAPFHNVFLGAETGFLKGINIEKKNFKNLNEVPREAERKDQEILVMCWGDDKEKEICIGLKNREVKTLDTNTYEFTHSMICDGGEGDLKGIAKYESSYLTCVESGLVKVWNSEEQQMELNVGSKIEKMRQNPWQQSLIATGGNETDLKVWDLEQGEAVYKAKNVKNDWLNLRVPVWISDLQFVPDSDRVVTCSRHHKVRVYDLKSSQRRPVIDMDYGEDPLTALTVVDENQVIVGSGIGGMALIDIRKGKMVNVYKGFSGAVKCVQCHPTLPMVASCGLDRHLRIHDIQSKEMLHKVYLKSRLNCLLFRTQWSQDDTNSDGEECSEEKELLKDDDTEKDEDDELWNKLEVVGQKRTKTKNSKEKKKRKHKM